MSSIPAPPHTTLSSLATSTPFPTAKTASNESMVKTAILYLRILTWGVFLIKWLFSKTVNSFTRYRRQHAQKALYHAVAVLSFLAAIYIALSGALQSAISALNIQSAIPPAFYLRHKCNANRLISGVSWWIHKPGEFDFDQTLGLFCHAIPDAELCATAIGTKELLMEAERVLEIGGNTYIQWQDALHGTSRSGGTLIDWLCYGIGLIDDHLPFCQVEHPPRRMYSDMNGALSVRMAIQEIVIAAIDKQKHIGKMHDSLEHASQLASEEERATVASIDATWPWALARSGRLIAQLEHHRRVRIHLSAAMCVSEIVSDTLRQTIATLELLEYSPEEMSPDAVIRIKNSLASLGFQLRAAFAGRATWHHLVERENAHTA
ncbi:hypothetical protein AURDEDRAFT_177226 [Auricularia subglabra TFB-10046 SS5]|uniref:Uncharacterized protein n=1 Tax=Auricularia subglabra (strain TFB-10046 / SS5) TaxID=717982 RepID=J0WP99_AURST|nr:hypothetical protein AURDEDRAFT_177226 [Auricularia subglabra TFB-10046 SS5]